MEKLNDKSSTNENLVYRFPTPPLESDKSSDSKLSGSTSFLIENLVSEKSPSDQTRCVAVYKGKHEFSQAEKDEKEDSKELSAQKDVHKNPDDFQLSAGECLLHKKPRTTFSTDQIRELEKRFESQKYLGTKERSELAAALGLTDTQIKTWFQNRRMKFKRHYQAASELSIEKFPSFSPAPGFSFGVPQGVPTGPMFYPPLYPGYKPLLLPYQGSDSCAAFYSRPRILCESNDHRAKASCMAFPPLENKLPWSYAPLLAPYFDVPTYAYP